MSDQEAMPPRVAVTIATRNRRQDLARTCEALQKLVPPPDEVLICADGCTDDTMEFVKSTYPSFRLFVNKTPRGSIGSRDLMMREATGEIIISLDDDSYPIDEDFVGFVQRLFLERPSLAVASFPQRSDEFPRTLTARDFGVTHQAGTFANCAAAIRRSAYLATGGYPTRFFHMYEEPDFALQCLAAGFDVIHFTDRVVRHHYTQQQRSELRRHFYNARNELWSVMLRCPLPYLFPVAIFRLLRQLGYARRQGLAWLLREPLWWASFIAGLPSVLTERQPIRWPIYREWMQRIRNAPKQEK